MMSCYYKSYLGHYGLRPKVTHSMGMGEARSMSSGRIPTGSQSSEAEGSKIHQGPKENVRSTSSSLSMNTLADRFDRFEAYQKQMMAEMMAEIDRRLPKPPPPEDAKWQHNYIKTPVSYAGTSGSSPPPIGSPIIPRNLDCVYESRIPSQKFVREYSPNFDRAEFAKNMRPERVAKPGRALVSPWVQVSV